MLRFGPAAAFSPALGLAVACSLLGACAAGGEVPGLPDAGGTGGAAEGTGGNRGSGGSASGGRTASGGQPATGGSGTGGSPVATGGMSAQSGGAPGSGGVHATGSGGAGGRSGGAMGTAGAGARGGAPGTGGRAAGGSSGAPPTLKKFVGNIDTRGQVRSDFAMYWNQLSPENAGKWGSVEATRNKMNWTSLDAMYAFAKDHNIPFKQHNFVWGSQQPSWLSGLSQADQRAEVEEWIRLYCERFPDTQLIDVVNEPPPHTTPAYMAALGGAGSSGYDWIVQAFKWAHQYCPSSILILNDYNNIENASDNSHTIDIVTRIKNAGAPINAVGAQAHGCANLSASTVKMYIDKITSQTGLPVYISEYDLNIADDNQQKSVMQSQFTMFWDDANVKGITLWGYVVGSTWVANSGLITSSGTKRPAMTWLIDFLGL